MTPLFNYAHYRRLQLRNAAILAGLDQVVLPALRGALVAFLAIIAYGVVSRAVEANQESADNRVAAKLASQAAYIKSLEAIVDRCTSPGDNVITVDGEVGFCGLTMTGIRSSSN